jgi:hypothetical protein
VPYLWRWRQMLRHHTAYDPALVDAHLRFVVKNRSA